VADAPLEYPQRLAAWRRNLAALDRQHLLIANGRLLAVAAAAAVAWLAARGSLSPGWLLAPAVAFAVLAFVHQRVLGRVERARLVERWYETSLARLDGQWPGRGRDGARFLDGHDYARDLDVFGSGSLFQLLNTTRTDAGETALAGWLRQGADIEEIRARQTAVDELRPQLDFRERVLVGATEAEAVRTAALGRWAAATSPGYARSAPWIFGACAVVLVALSAAAYAAIVPASVVIGWLFVESAVVWLCRRSFQTVVDQIGKPAHDLAALAELLVVIEQGRFATPRLRRLQSALEENGVHASREVARLGGLVSLLDSSTHNLLFRPFTMALLVPQQIAIAIDTWRRAHGRAVGEWLRVVGELEAFAALSTYAYEHPADPFPVLVAGEALFDAEALGHPLLPDHASVRNDVMLGGGGPRVMIVSGSNMSGKSTLLRAVGMNVVLALAGAPVRAVWLRLSPLAVGATLRVEDSLQEGRSQFYAEILRIRTIVERARGPLPLLFLLDEILHGTNSHDRRVGAEAVVRALAGAGAIGLVTTHDLALTELPAGLNAGLNVAAVNTHFEDRLEDGRMVFDYRMRPGVVTHSNALALMRAVGLDV
jgi:hypothetical protein